MVGEGSRKSITQRREEEAGSRKQGGWKLGRKRGGRIEMSRKEEEQIKVER